MRSSERGFSLVIGLLMLPFLFPMPPGFTTILGSACLLLSLQMTVGRRSPWLPKRVAQFQFPEALARQVLQQLEAGHTVDGAVCASPSDMPWRQSSHIWQINGLCIRWLTFLLMLPIPMTNPIPTIGILMIEIATLESDGVLMCLGYGATALITGVFGVAGYGLWQSPDLLLRWFQ
jgi:hypothetical protein